jgi:DNA-binding HxlR family transcriptional regulator
MSQREPAVCATFHRAVELIGRRWTGAIIQVLLQGRARYCVIRAAIPRVNDRMLSERLRELELEGIVERTVIPETPVRVEYELTRKGRSLQKTLDALAEWAERWRPEVTAMPQRRGKQAAGDRHGGDR